MSNQIVFRDFRTALSARAAKCRLSVAPTTVDALEAYFRLLAHWNKKINLTSLPLDKPTEATVDRLFIEPLAAADRLLGSADAWFDLGSGGGSPAIPMKVSRPGAKLSMVESRSKKTAFLREAVRELRLKDTDVVESRFEALSSDGSRLNATDIVTVRAVRPDLVLFQTANYLLRSGGRLIIFGTAAPALATGFDKPEQVKFPPSGSVHVFRKG